MNAREMSPDVVEEGVGWVGWGGGGGGGRDFEVEGKKGAPAIRRVYQILAYIIFKEM